MTIFDPVSVNPVAQDLRRRAAIARAIILGTPAEEPPGPEQSQIGAFARGLLNRLTGGLVPINLDLPAMAPIDRTALTDEQRARFNALPRIEQGLAETSHPEYLRRYDGETLKLLFPAKEYQAIRSGDRAVLYNPNDPADLHPIEETYNLSPGAAHYVGTQKVSEQPPSFEMDPVSRVNAGLRAGTLSKDQADAYIRKLTQITDAPVMVVPTGDGSTMQVVPKRAGATFDQPVTPISAADRAKSEAAWQQFQAHLKGNPALLEKGPAEAVTDFGIATSVSDPEAIKYLKLHPGYLDLFRDEEPLGTPKRDATPGAPPPQGARPAPAAPAASSQGTASSSSTPTIMDQAIDAVKRLGRDPGAVVERASSMLARDLTPEEKQRILQAGMTPPALLDTQPPPAAVVTPDQGGISAPRITPVEGASGTEAELRARLATTTDPQLRAQIVEMIRAFRANSAGGGR